MKRAAIYIRVSTKEQAESGDSIPAQRDKLHKWAKDHNYRIVEEYVDAGESARVSDRPAFLRLVQDARKRMFDAVLVWKWDRFARNAEDATLYKAILRRQCGVQVMSISDPPGEGAIGQLIERILDVVAEFQSLATAEHVSNTMAYLARQGRWLSGPPFGYQIGEDGRLTPDPETAPVVRWIFEQYARGKAASWIVRELAAGRPYPVSAQRRWVVKTVKEMLGNPVYRGVVRWNTRKTEVVPTENGSRKQMSFRDPEEWIEVPGAHEPLVSEDLWREVQIALKDRARVRGDTEPHALKGLVRCAQCGGSMFRNRDKRRTPRWECSKYYRVRPDDRCRPMVAIPEPVLLARVEEALQGLIEGEPFDPRDVLVEEDTAHDAQRRLKAVQEQKKRLLQAYLAGVLELEEFATQKKELEEEESRLRTAQASVDVEEVRSRLKDAAAELAAKLRTGDPEEVGALARRVIGAIIVDRQRKEVRVRWRWHS